MRQMTISLREEQAQWIEENIGEGEQYESKSEAIRSLMDRHGELEKEMEELQQENNRLHRERRLLLEQREEHTELVRHVQDEREDRKQKRQKENAPVWRRAKWWVLGVPLED